ncbi:MAG TPA: glycosyltransferase [Ignavibacteriaceae bacterium]|nr:glycosyltransferase [Ignavibacteriaceae bacterium]
MNYKIFQFSFGDGYAGSAKMAILSSKALLDKGHRVKLFVSKDSVTKRRALEKRIPIVELDSRQKLSSLVKVVIQKIGTDHPDFAVAYHSQDRKVVMKLKAKFKKELISVAYRQNISLSTPFIGSILYNRYFDYMIACSQGVAENLINEGIKKSKVLVIHNTTEIPGNISNISGEQIRNHYGMKDKIVLGISSWFHKERKGFDILFEAFSKLDDRFVLLIIGIPKENQKAVVEYASTFGISEEKIIMPGFIDNIYEYYKAMDIFLLPSRSEGFSLALLEAAASGLPIIASDILGNDEFIEHKKNGLLFNLAKPDELTQHVITLTDNKILANQYGSLAEENFIQEFTLERYAEKLNTFFDEAYSTLHKAKTSQSTSSTFQLLS